MFPIDFRVNVYKGRTKCYKTSNFSKIIDSIKCDFKFLQRYWSCARKYTWLVNGNEICLWMKNKIR